MTDMITIDASALSSIDYTQYLYDYFASLGTTAGTNTYYGGSYTEDLAGYYSGSQYGVRYAGTTNDAQVLMEGTAIQYDGVVGQHGAYSGTVDSVTFGFYDENTTYTQDDDAGTRTELTGVIQGLLVSDLGISEDVGTTASTTDNSVYQLMDALKKATTAESYIDLLYEIFASKAQHFIGSDGNDNYVGTDYGDLIDGGLGTDTMAGGSGDDTYVVDDSGDVVTENDGEGSDTVETSLNHYQIGDYVENLTLTGSDDLYGYGNSLDNVITGNSGANKLYGMEGDDTLDGGDGTDTLTGGAGDDTYVVGTGDVVVEADDEGSDTVQTTRNHYLLGDYVENLVQTGSDDLYGYGNSLDNELTGNSGDSYLAGQGGNDTLDGGDGTDTLNGGADDDTYIVGDGDVVVEADGEGTDTVQTAVDGYTLGDYVENLTLTDTADISGYGNSLDNVLTGNSGANTLDGDSGADTMIGGAGNDSYVVNSLDDVLTEVDGEGTDSVEVSVSHYQMAAYVEELTQTGTDSLYSYGNSLDNVMTGNSGASYLAGLDGDDTLDGGDGADTLSGGAGDDIFIVGTGDTVTEKTQAAADAGGTDTVKTAVNNYVLGDFIENLTLTGTALKGSGNELANTITGNAGANTLLGLVGNDTLNGAGGADILKGAEGKDTLLGGAGTDTLYGGIGQDTMTGGAGADTFHFSSSDTAATKAKADLILDFGAKQGDLLDLSGIDAKEGRKGNQAFDFIGDDAFSGHQGELRVQQIDGETYVFGDTDGDKKIDFSIHFDDAINFKEDYFVL